MLVRLSLPGQGPHGEPRPHPAYGDQLQNRGIPGRVPAEGQAIFSYTEREVSFSDGETVPLRVPRIEFTALQFGELGADIMISPRIAPAMVGLGLLEAVPEQSILAIAKEQEKLGVSGKPNYVWDHENSRTVLGRFGWKAGNPICASRRRWRSSTTSARPLTFFRRRIVRVCRCNAWTCRPQASAAARADAPETTGRRSCRAV